MVSTCSERSRPLRLRRIVSYGIKAITLKTLLAGSTRRRIIASASLAGKSGSVGRDGSAASNTASSVCRTRACTGQIWLPTTFFESPGRSSPYHYPLRSFMAARSRAALGGCVWPKRGSASLISEHGKRGLLLNSTPWTLLSTQCSWSPRCRKVKWSSFSTASLPALRSLTSQLRRPFPDRRSGCWHHPV